MWLSRIFLCHSSFSLERSSASVLMVYMHEDKKLLRAGGGREIGMEESRGERKSLEVKKFLSNSLLLLSLLHWKVGSLQLASPGNIHI